MKNKVIMIVAVVLLLALGVSLIAFSGKMSEKIRDFFKDNIKTENNSSGKDAPTDEENNGESEITGEFVFLAVLGDDAYVRLTNKDDRDIFLTGFTLYHSSGEQIVYLTSTDYEPVFSWNVSEYVEIGESYYVVGHIWGDGMERSDYRSDTVTVLYKYETCSICGWNMSMQETGFCTNPSCENYG